MRNQKRINELYSIAWETYRPDIMKLCSYYLHSTPDVIDDCCQNVFLAYYEALYSNKKIMNVAGWLHKTAYQQAKYFQRKNYITNKRIVPIENQKAMELPEASKNPDYIEELIKRKFSDEEIYQMLISALTPEEYNSLNDFFLEPKNMADLASQLNIGINAVYQRKWALKSKLSRIAKSIIQEIENDLLKR